MNSITIEDFKQLVEKNENLNIIDVRLERGFNINHIDGAVNIPLNALPSSIDKLDKQKHYYIICQVGASSLQGTQFLKQHGYNVTNVESGMASYSGKTTSKSN